jgi:uncharacterized protein GlcG (DUF336 family)
MTTSLTLAQADAIADRALQAGRDHQFQPLTVAVLDAGGHLKVLKRGDGSSLLRPDIAMGKAWGALGMGFGGRELARRAEKMPAFFTALNAMSDGRMVPVPGGALIRDAAGAIVGAIGISGDTSDNDEVCVIAGVESQGLVADTGDRR